MSKIHIVAPFEHSNTSAWAAIDLYLSLVQENCAELWGYCRPHQDLFSYPIKMIEPYKGFMPSNGILYVVTPAKIGHWYDQAKFERVLLIHNSCDQESFYSNAQRLSHNGKSPVEFIFGSEMIKNSIGLSGEVVYPSPNPVRLLASRESRNSSNSVFTVGRLCKDIRTEHHPSDIELYKDLARLGLRIKIIGGTCLTPWLKNISEVELLPEIDYKSAMNAMSSFDCLFFRACSRAKEGYGLSIAEAINFGLPVVAYADGGYAEWLPKEKGFLFNTNQEALKHIKFLAKKQSCNYQPRNYQEE